LVRNCYEEPGYSIIPAFYLWRGGQMITRSNLTKKFLMELNDGNYIISNTFFQKGVPIYGDWVSVSHRREKQWRDIVAASVDQRLFNVFKSKGDAQKWLLQIFK
jgi:hypothetical protein